MMESLNYLKKVYVIVLCDQLGLPRGLLLGCIVIAITFYGGNPSQIRLVQANNTTIYSGIYAYNEINYNFTYIIPYYGGTCMAKIGNWIFIGGVSQMPNSLYQIILKNTAPLTSNPEPHLCFFI